MESIVKNVFGEKIYPDFSWSFDDKKDERTKEVPDSSWDDEARTIQTFPYNDAEDFDESKEELTNDGAIEAPNIDKEEKVDTDESEAEVEEEYGSNEFSPKLEKVIEGAQRILQKIRKLLQRNDKFSIQQTQKDIDYLFNKLDRASVEMSGNKEQFERIEKLFDEVGEVTESNIKMRIAINEEEERRQQMPKAHLMTWDGSHCSFHDFRMHMLHVLRYGNEQLNLSSLKSQIQDSKEKPKIIARIENCTTVDSAFRTLEKFYGNIEIIQAKLKSQLDHLPEYPESLDDESNNVEKILGYMSKMKKFGLEEKYIDENFIHRYMHKLHHERCQQVADKEISTSKDFESFLHQILSTNQKILLTKP